MFSEEENDILEDTFSLRHQSGDMFDLEEDDVDDDINQYFFRFCRALSAHDRAQMVKDANEKWSLISLGDRSPTKVRFADTVDFKDHPDDEESKKETQLNQCCDNEEDFEIFSSRLFNEIINDLNSFSRTMDTLSRTDLNDETAESDSNNHIEICIGSKAKESTFYPTENDSKENTIENNLNSIKINCESDNENKAKIDKQNSVETATLLHQLRDPVSSKNSVELVQNKSSLRTLSENDMQVPRITSLNRSILLCNDRNIPHPGQQNEYKLSSDSNNNTFLELKSEEESYNVQNNKILYLRQEPNFALNKTQVGINLNKLKSVKEDLCTVANKNCLVKTQVKQNSPTIQEKLEISSEELLNNASQLIEVKDNICLVSQSIVPIKLDAKKKSKPFLQKCKISKSNSKKNKLDIGKICNENLGINKKEVKSLHILKLNEINNTSVKVKSALTKSLKLNKIKSDIKPPSLSEKQKNNVNKSAFKTISLLRSDSEKITSGSNTMSHKQLKNKTSFAKPKNSVVETETKINKNTTSSNTISKRMIVSSGGKSKQIIPNVLLGEKNSPCFELPDRCRIKKKATVSKHSQEKTQW